MTQQEREDVKLERERLRKIAKEWERRTDRLLKDLAAGQEIFDFGECYP